MRCLVIGCKGVQGRKRMATIPGAMGIDIDDSWPAWESFEAGIVCVPDALKIETVTALLEHGKHVMVEKPLLGAQALRSLVALCGEQRLTLYTAYNFRFEPMIQKLREHLHEIGRLYTCRMHLANGTVTNIRTSWRDIGIRGGVVGNVGVHLLDLAWYLFGIPKGPWQMIEANKFECAGLDHVIFGCPKFTFEASYISWRNTFTLDALGEFGSLHIDGLCKWGPSSLTMRMRNDAKPNERGETVEQAPDPTYRPDYEEFARLIGLESHTLDRDLWIDSIVEELCNAG